MEGNILVTEGAGPVATVVLNRPEKLNALTRPMWRHLGDAFEELAASDTVRCIVIRGAGTKAFAPGNDISEFASERSNVEQARAYGEDMRRTIETIGNCRHPVVAQIHGICVGGGLEIAAMCDLRICGASSRFGVPINKLGLTMGYGELTGLLALVGRAVALEILLEGRVFDAAEALQKRLVNRVVPDGQVEFEAYATAQRVAAGAPLVARWHKQFIERLTVSAKILPAEWDEGFACFDTKDYHTGVAAFLQKQKPVFEGK